MTVYNPFAGGGGQAPGGPPKDKQGSGYNPFAGGGKKKKTGQPAMPAAPAAPALPFMAEGLDHRGQAYYGQGFQGFARKTFAKIFDPKFYLPRPSEQQAKLVEQAGQTGENLLNDKLGWDQWMGKWTGITAEEVSETAASVRLGIGTTSEIDPLTGEETLEDKSGLETAGSLVAAGMGTVGRGAYQGVWMGLSALGVVDVAMRKTQAVNMALDEIGDSSGILPDATRLSEIVDKIWPGNEAAQRLAAFVDGANDLQLPFLAYNALRAITAGGEMADKWKTVTDHTRASNMVYTMYWDEAKKAEYFQRLKAGENPDMLMSELEMPWVELGGSVFGDPTTYLGVGIIGKVGKAKTPVRVFGKTLFSVPWEVVGRVPTFSEIFGLKSIGRAKIASAGEMFTRPINSSVDNALRALEKTADDADALVRIRSAVEASAQAVKRFATEYGVLTPESTAKADIMKKTVGTVFSAMGARFRTADDIVETFRAFRNLKSADPELAAKGFNTLKEMFGTMPFSHGGMQAMEFMNRIEDGIPVADLVAKHPNDLPKLVEELTGRLSGIVDDMYPSINDMAAAAQKALQKGAVLTERETFLARSYKTLQETKPAVLFANKINNMVAGNKAWQGLQGWFAGVHMGMTPGYAMRNLQNNTFTIWQDLGSSVAAEAAVEGLETMVRSTGQQAANAIKKIGNSQQAANATKVDWVTSVVDRQLSAIRRIVGSVPTETVKGVGSAGREGVGFLQVGQDIEKVQSAVIVRHVVEREMEKALRYGGIPSVKALENVGLSPEASNRLYSLALEHWGDTKQILKAFRDETARGFEETWRHLELDPDFKDWLRKIDMHDELETIRKTSADASEFADRMAAFEKRLDDLATRVGNEPALVSADNPMSEGVVAIERAFDEGKDYFGREEMNRFRALTELYDQLRTHYTNISHAMYGQLASKLPPEITRTFDQRFAALNEVFSKGIGSTRNLAQDVYDGVYAASKKGTPPAEWWDKARAVIFDVDDAGQPVLKRVSLREAFPGVDPSKLGQKEAQSRLWTWVKETQQQFWRGYNQHYLTGQDGILEEMAATAGTTLDEIKTGYYGTMDNPQLTRLSDLMGQIREWETHIDFESFQDLRKTLPEGASKLSDMIMEQGQFKGGISHLFNAVNADRARMGQQAYATIDDVPFEEAVAALKKRAKPVPPYVEGTSPTLVRQLHENLNGGAREALHQFRDGTLSKWGEVTPIDSGLTDEIERGLATWSGELDRRMVSARATAMAVANEQRNFILHDYNKNYLDKFLGFGFQYHYWPSRTYGKWAERAVDAPGTLSTYAKLHETLDKVYADTPEWYRYNLPVTHLLGRELKNPLYFNLEATLNPLNGLTGVDFNDPNKRVDWLSSAVDDMGKMGFSVGVPLQWAMAFNLYKKGEDDAARRWIGRAVPATQTLKAALNLADERLGLDLMPDISALPGSKHGEFDPFINIFHGGMDSSEEKRVGRAIAGMIQDGTITPEQAQDAIYNRSGDIWDAGVQRAINERAPGQLASYFLGVGYKARTEGDKRVEQFYAEYSKLLSMRENISPENYRKEYDRLLAQYPESQAVLLAKRGGDDRDAAYAYSVLNRLPPGDSFNVLRDMGLSEDLVNKFYDTKGNFESWTEQDKNRFMGAMLDIGATYAMPDDATRQSWTEAKNEYQAVRTAIAEELGEDIWDKISTYYDLKDTDVDKANEFLELNPEISEAFTLQQEAKIESPVLFEYYGSLDLVEQYYAGRTRSFLADKYGKDITDLQTEYFNLGVESKSAQKAFLRAHPELKGYWTDKNRMDEEANRKIVELAISLPDAAPGAEIRDDFSPANATQQLLAEFSGTPPKSWQEVSAPMSSPLQTRVIDYWTTGAPLNNAALKELDYLARKDGYYGTDDLLRQAGYSYLTQGQQGQQPQGQPLQGGYNPFTGQ